jgi:muramidase (phage lysozyme)
MRPVIELIAYVGAASRWGINALSNKVRQAKNKSFNKFLHGEIRSDNWSENSGNKTYNFIIGTVTIIVLIIILNNI